MKNLFDVIIAAIKTAKEWILLVCRGAWLMMRGVWVVVDSEYHHHRPPQSVGSRILFYPMSIMPKIFIEDSGNLKHPKIVKSINRSNNS